MPSLQDKIISRTFIDRETLVWIVLIYNICYCIFFSRLKIANFDFNVKCHQIAEVTKGLSGREISKIAIAWQVRFLENRAKTARKPLVRVEQCQTRLLKWFVVNMLPEKFAADTFPNVSQFCHTESIVFSSKICFYFMVETCSRVAKLGNIAGETFVSSKCFWQRVSSFCKGFIQINLYRIVRETFSHWYFIFILGQRLWFARWGSDRDDDGRKGRRSSSTTQTESRMAWNSVTNWNCWVHYNDWEKQSFYTKKNLRKISHVERMTVRYRNLF